MAARTSTSRPLLDTIPVPDKITVALIVNGIEAQLRVAPWTTLLDALRDHLNLTGTRRAAITANAAPVRCWWTGGASTPASRSPS